MVVWGLLAVILLLISVNDFLFFRIEDEYNAAMCVLYITACIFGISGKNFLIGFATAVVVFFITLAMNHRDMIGGGDVKMLFPMILFAENNLYTFALNVSVAGVFVSLAYILFGKHIYGYRRKIVLSLMKFRKNNKKNRLLNIALLSLGRITNRTSALTYRVENVWRQEVPYGIALSYGGFCVILENLLSR